MPRQRGQAGMESALHRSMKERASRELEREGYSVFFEPPSSPSRFMSWGAYRPDVFGVRTGAETQDYALVECETRPSGRRLGSKDFRSVRLQAQLNREPALRMILVIPRGTLGRLEPSLRLTWETWVFGEGGVLRLPRALPPAH